MTGAESLGSDRVRERLTDVDHGIHHNGNDHRQGPLANCPKCVAVGLLAELDEARAALTMLRDAWNAHFDTCPQQALDLPMPTADEIRAWMEAPSDTASA